MFSCNEQGSCRSWRFWRPRSERHHLSRNLSLSLPKPPTGFSNHHLHTNEIDDKKSVLQVQHVDACIAKNGIDHKTDLYEETWRDEDKQLVVRRGQSFLLKISLSRPYVQDHDAVSFIFTLQGVESPKFGQGTIIAVPLLPKTGQKNKDNWLATIEGRSGSDISVLITPSSNCIVGKWSMDVDTKLMDSKTLNFNYSGYIYVLFNPWNIYDTVYIREDNKKSEYVLSESGLMYRGTHKIKKPTVWKYSQFDKNMLECSLMIVSQVGKVPVGSRNDPVAITRALSAAVNSPDDNGVVMGNWTEEFDGGTNPIAWIGSKKILDKYYNKKKPVKYGQCWVFAGVLTTVCRALGIPARPVTCYVCGHDSKNSLTIDYFCDEKGELMEELQNESTWNFHVWVEVYMRRPDIGNEFDGWQVIDATPQELSDNQFRCGPASVTAIKTGQILRPYDSGFAFSMANADIVYWKYYGPTQPLKLIKKETQKVGQSIVTKAVGQWKMDDITDSYKYPDNSAEERSTMYRALKKSGELFSRYYLNEEFSDVKFDFQLVDDIVIGSSFGAVLKMKNKSASTNYTIDVTLTVKTVLYTGKSQEMVRQLQRLITVEKKTADEFKMEVSYHDYAKKMVPHCSFNVTCHAHVRDTDFDYFAEDDFRVRQPDIRLEVIDPPVINKNVRVVASFVNPLPVNIKKGYLTLDGPGIVKKKEEKIENILANMKVQVEFVLRPDFIGKHTLVAKFTSKELDDVDGFLSIVVEDPPKE